MCIAVFFCMLLNKGPFFIDIFNMFHEVLPGNTSSVSKENIGHTTPIFVLSVQRGLFSGQQEILGLVDLQYPPTFEMAWLPSLLQG